MKKRFIKIISAFVLVCLAAGIFPCVQADAEESEPVVILAGSDFQAETNESSAANVKSIISAVKRAGYTNIDGFLFGGDYNTEYDDKTEEIQFLKDTVKGEYPGLEDDKMVFVQGNHDPAESKGLSKSGENDTDDYGVYVIHEDDYMWYNNNETTVKNTAAALEAYLKSKAEENYSHPIFVFSHLALNYSKRTYNDGDGMYAKYIFDVLNKYGGEGLNIIFLFGHDHNNKYDDYIGGSAIYLAKGDTIYISKPGQRTAVPDAYTLNFTYLNAGYVGTAYCLNNTLSMTVFEIKDDIVKIQRYCASGEFSLKTEGAWAESLNESAATYGATDEYLLVSYPGAEYAGSTASDSDITVVSKGIISLSAEKSSENPRPGYYTAFAGYKISAQGYTEGTYTLVTVKPDESFDAYSPVFIKDTNTGKITCHTVENGKITFESDRLGSYEIYQTKGVALSAQKAVIYTPVSQFADKTDFIIVSSSAEGPAFALKNENGTDISASEVEIKQGYGGLYISTDDDTVKWNFVNDTDFGYADIIGDLKNLSTGKYLVAKDGNTLSTADDTEDKYTAWRIASNNYGMYTLYDNGTPERYYVKFADGSFTVSDTTDSAIRVYLFAGTEVDVNVTAYTDCAEGYVESGAGGDTASGGKLYLVSTDGTVNEIDITVSMLKDTNGESASTSSDGVYTGLKVYYDNTVICGDYTLRVGNVASDAGGNISDTNTPASYWLWIAVAAFAVAAIIIVAVICKKKKAK